MAIVDGISEMGEIKTEMYDPVNGGKDTQLVIYTSRNHINIPGIITIIPLGLQLNYIDHLLDGFINYYAGAFKFGEQREILRNKTIKIIKQINSNSESGDVPILILRLIVEIASRIYDMNMNLEDNLPETFSDLIDDYIMKLFIKYDNINELIKKIRKASLISLGIFNTNDVEFILNNLFKYKLIPQWFSLEIYKKYLDSKFINDMIVSGIMITSGNVGEILIKFSFDSLAEYLACKELLILFRDGDINSEIANLFYINSKNINSNFSNLLNKMAESMNVKFSLLKICGE